MKNDFRIQNNFKLSEFIDAENKAEPTYEQLFNVFKLSEKMQQLRNKVGSITINSAFRDFNRNVKVNGSRNSHHLKGLAADIKFDFKTVDYNFYLKLLKNIGFTNVNFYVDQVSKNFVWFHVDIGKTWNGKAFNYRVLDAYTHAVIKEIEVV